MFLKTVICADRHLIVSCMDNPAQKKVGIPKPRLQEEIQNARSALMQERENFEETRQQGKRKAAADLGNVQ